MRLWNRGTDMSSNPEIPFVPGTPLELGNSGITITIEGNAFQPGQHWILSVRPETPTQVVPWEFEEMKMPNGYRRFFAPLAVIGWQRDKDGITGKVIHDCRRTFRPLTLLDGCCTYSVGDNVNSFGDFSDIQTAVDHLPDEGGRICVLPGVHLANLAILNREGITIHGCGEKSILRPTLKDQDQPVIFISSSDDICIEGLTIEAARGVGILVRDHGDGPFSHSTNIKIHNKSISC